MLQGRCNREKPACKYFHPPQHLKDQLLINGRNHLALKNALAQQMQQQIIPGQMPAATMVSVTAQLTIVRFQSIILPSTAPRMLQCRSPTRPTYPAWSPPYSRAVLTRLQLSFNSPLPPSSTSKLHSRYSSSNRPSSATTELR